MTTEPDGVPGSDLAAVVGALADKEAITEVLHRYCRAMDRNDAELGYSVWHADGTADYEGMFVGTGRDFVDFGQDGHRRAFVGTSHQVTNVTITLDGDRAASECCVTAANRILGAGAVYVIRGRCFDSWSRRDGEWRIDHRRFATDVSQVLADHQVAEHRAEHRAEATIERSADDVWAVIGDFGELSWYPGVARCVLEGNDRTTWKHGSALASIERILIDDDETRTHHYVLVGFLGDTLLPDAKGGTYDARKLIGHHSATLTVTPLPDGRSHVTYDVTVDGDDDGAARISHGYSEALANLKTRLEA